MEFTIWSIVLVLIIQGVWFEEIEDAEDVDLPDKFSLREDCRVRRIPYVEIDVVDFDSCKREVV